MQNQWTIDWLSTTFKGSLTDTDVRDAVAFGFPKRAWTVGTPHFGYSTMLQHPMGHFIMSNPGRPEMGVHLSIGGRALKAMDEGGHTPLSMLQWSLREGGKTTRIDLAIDVFDEEIDISAMARSKQVDGAKGSARGRKLMEGEDGGRTLYIGSRQSDKFFRIYDKAVETGDRSRPWTRFELEIKGDTAKKVAFEFANLLEGQHAPYIKGIMKAMFNPDDALYQAIMSAPAVHVTAPKDTSDNTLEWLLNSVAKTLAKTIARRSDVDVGKLFLDAVEANYQAILQIQNSD